MNDEAGWLEWSRDHPWLFAALTGAILGVVMGLIATDEEDSVAVGVVAGLFFAIMLFVVGGVWGSVLKRSAERKTPTESRLGAWRKRHSVRWAMLMAVAGFLTVFLIEWFRGRPVTHALVLASGVPVIVLIIAVLGHYKKI